MELATNDSYSGFGKMFRVPHFEVATARCGWVTASDVINTWGGRGCWDGCRSAADSR